MAEPDEATEESSVRVRVRVIQMVFLLLCMAEPDKTTEKSTGKQPHGRER